MNLPDSPRFHVIEPAAVAFRPAGLAPRPLYVYLPEAATQQRRRRFPVLYCHDGQNIWDDPHVCFGHGGWHLNRIVDQLTAAGEIAPIILVGIPHGAARYREYTPGASYDESAAHPYANFVRGAVKPLVDEKFPTRPGRAHTALLGSSLGGLISLWMAHQFPDTFSQAACLSGAFQVRDRRGQTFLKFVQRRAHQRLRLYLDSGTVEDDAPLTRRVHEAYRDRGWRDGRDLQHFEEEGAAHNEACWRDRVWRALVFLFGRSVKVV